MKTIGSALSSIGDRTRLAENILQLARERFGGDHGFLLELEETTSSLRETATFGEVEEMLNQDMRIFMQYGANHPLEKESLVIAPEAKVLKQLSARKSVRRDMTRGVLIFPLAAGEHAVGAIYLGEKKPGSLKLKGVKEADLFEIGQVLGQMINLDHTLQRLTLQNKAFQQEMREKPTFDQLVGKSEAMDRIRRALELVSDTDIAVTLIGESGSGISTAAEALHYHSLRKRKPLLTLALQDFAPDLHEMMIFGQAPGVAGGPARGRRGVIREAKGGTVVLEGIDHLPHAVQDKLVLAMDQGRTTDVGNHQDYDLDVRFVFTISSSPREQFGAGKLTQDFYLKMNIFPVILPPLKDRINDLPLLVEHFIEQETAAFGKSISGVTSEVYDFLGTWEWPGNLNELEREVRQAVLRAPDKGVITPNMLSRYLLARTQPAMMDAGEGTLKQRVGMIEKRMVMDALERNNHNQSLTADLLGLSRQALINKMIRYNIEGGRKYKRKLREIQAKAKKEK